MPDGQPRTHNTYVPTHFRKKPRRHPAGRPQVARWRPAANPNMSEKSKLLNQRVEISRVKSIANKSLMFSYDCKLGSYRIFAASDVHVGRLEAQRPAHRAVTSEILR